MQEHELLLPLLGTRKITAINGDRSAASMPANMPHLSTTRVLVPLSVACADALSQITKIVKICKHLSYESFVCANVSASFLKHPETRVNNHVLFNVVGYRPSTSVTLLTLLLYQSTTQTCRWKTYDCTSQCFYLFTNQICVKYIHIRLIFSTAGV